MAYPPERALAAHFQSPYDDVRDDGGKVNTSSARCATSQA